MDVDAGFLEGHCVKRKHDIDVVCLYQVESSFPLVVAMNAICADRRKVIGECFLLVSNKRPYMGFQRLLMPLDTTQDDAMARMHEEARRIHRKMWNAASRRALLPEGAADSGLSRLLHSPLDTLADLWGVRGFSAHLDWIGERTASSNLRAHIEKCFLDNVANQKSSSIATN